MSDSASSQGSSVSGASSASGGASVASDAAALRLDDGDQDESLNDLLDQKKGLQELVFACLYTITRNKRQSSLRLACLRVVLEFLQMFRVIFNTSFPVWRINKNLFIWKAIYWVLVRFLVWDKGYTTYVKVFYVIAGAILLTIGLTVLAAWMLKKEENAQTWWMKRLLSFLQLSTVLFSVFWVSLLEYMVFLLDCDWKARGGPHHGKWHDVKCLEMPHLANMAFAGATCLVFMAVTLLLSVSDTDLNPMSHNMTASPDAGTSIMVLGLKMVMVFVSTILGFDPALQPVLMIVCVGTITYFLLRRAIYYSDWLNHVWVGLWFGLLYVCGLLVYGWHGHLGQEAYLTKLTWAVLYGIFPAVAVGMLVSWLHMNKWLRRSVGKLETACSLGSYSDLRTVHRFKSPQQVELLLRAMRRWDEDDVPDPEAARLGAFIIECGLARFPNSCEILIRYANFLLVAKGDGQAAQTQLSLAASNGPDFLQRYFIYVIQQHAKDVTSAADGMDLLGYIEFKRNYRACVKAHKLALMSQRHFWKVLLQDTVSYRNMQQALQHMQQAQKQAHQVYKRVLERYPTDGKLLKVYGRFQEFVMNDPWTANRCYSEATKHGLSENLMDLVTGSAGQEAGKNIVKVLGGEVNEAIDGMIIIDARGTILITNPAASTMFGHNKGDLEGKNVSMLMPPPFCDIHDTFLDNFAKTGKAKILNSRRDVVAVTKHHTIFPVSLCVTKLTGSGQESIFFGVVKRMHQQDSNTVKVWTTAGGTVLCCDESFKDRFGVDTDDVLGKVFSSMCADPEAADRYTRECSELQPELVDSGTHSLDTQMLHKYTGKIDVRVTVQLGGTVAQRLLMFQICCLAEPQAVFVTDPKGSIVHANSKFATLVGYDVKTLTNLNFTALVPSPAAQVMSGALKGSWAATPPVLSCRSGSVVHLLHANKSKVPVTVKLSSAAFEGHKRHVVEVTPSSNEAQLDQQRMVLQVNQYGVVLTANKVTGQPMFGLEASELAGRPVAAFINVFAQWRQKYGEDVSLLAMLCAKTAAADTPGSVIVRVGVHTPVDDDKIMQSADAADRQEEQKSDLLWVLQQQHCKEHAAILTMQSALSTDANGALKLDNLTDDTPVLQLELWNPHMLCGFVEVDRHMHIAHGDATAGLILGKQVGSLLKSSITSLLGMSSSLTQDDLMSGNITSERAVSKKATLKNNAASRVGVARNVEGCHADGAPVKIEMQAVSMQSGHKQQLQLLLRCKDDCVGSLQPLLVLLGKATPDTAGPIAPDLAPAGGQALDAVQGAQKDVPAGSQESGGSSTDDDASYAASRLGSEGGSSSQLNQAPLHSVAAWLSQGGPTDAVGPEQLDEEHGTNQIESPAKLPLGPAGHGEEDESRDQEEPPDAAVSVASGSQQGGSVASGSEAGDAESSAAGDEQAADDLGADLRRAKRLKKLVRMLTSRAANDATETFSKTSKLLVPALVLYHVMSFVILTIDMQASYENAYAVDAMATIADRSQLTAMRAVQLQQCFRPAFSTMNTCSAAAIQDYKNLLYTNVEISRHNHQGLYLGFSKAHTFRDPRLREYWTYHGLYENNVLFTLDNGTSVTQTAQRPLWQQGNRYISAGEDLLYWCIKLRDSLNTRQSYHYVVENGHNSIFTGYAWSLDVLVDYAWKQLGTLSTKLIALVVCEVGIFSLACILWQFIVSKLASNQAMKRFSVFLALTSATLRVLASQPCQVEDDSRPEENEDDEFGATLLDAEQEQQHSMQAENKAPAGKKSVRMFVGGADDDDAQPDTAAARSRRKKDSKSDIRRGRDKARHRVRPPPTMLDKLYKQTVGRLFLKIKVNGKKMVTDDVMIRSLMAPLILWVVVVVIIYGVSFQALVGLQAPLASLNAAAHTLYRTGRVRTFITLFAFEEDRQKVVELRRNLQTEVDLLRQEYNLLLYGGEVTRVADVSFDATCPVGIFQTQQAAHLLFTTQNCLRADQSTCYDSTSKYYQITHSGLDAIMLRFLENVDMFAKLPESLAWPNHTLYIDSTMISPKDLYDGMKTLQSIFVNHTIQCLGRVKVLHVILLVATVVAAMAYMVLTCIPYARKLRTDGKMIAGVLSHLPAETDVESIVKTTVFSYVKPEAAQPASANTNSSSLGPGAYNSNHLTDIGVAADGSVQIQRSRYPPL